MLFTVDDASWVAIGAYNAIEYGIRYRVEKNKEERLQSIVRAMTDKSLESRVREEVCSVTSLNGFDEIWTKIEAFKRDNPHITHYLDGDYWNYVGKERFPFTYAKYCEAMGKSKLTKSDERMLSTYRGWVVTLLMTTHGKRSEMSAMRVAIPMVYGATRDTSWTREFG